MKQNLKDKTVFITGASDGIGRATALAFAGEGARLIISSRREDKINKVADEIRNRFKTDVFSFPMDVRNRKGVFEKTASLQDSWKEIDFLINNAGLSRGFDKIYNDNPDGWDEMIDTNIKGLLNVTKAVLPGMVERKRGHIINIGSIAGHEAYPNGAVYCSTKHAVDAITKAMRMDLLGSNVKVSTIDPGMVETNFSNVRFYGDTERAKNVYKGVSPLKAEDIAETIIFCASRPAHVNIAEVVILAGAQASATLVHRNP